MLDPRKVRDVKVMSDMGVRVKGGGQVCMQGLRVACHHPGDQGTSRMEETPMSTGTCTPVRATRAEIQPTLDGTRSAPDETRRDRSESQETCKGGGHGMSASHAPGRGPLGFSWGASTTAAVLHSQTWAIRCGCRYQALQYLTGGAANNKACEVSRAWSPYSGCFPPS